MVSIQPMNKNRWISLRLAMAVFILVAACSLLFIAWICESDRPAVQDLVSTIDGDKNCKQLILPNGIQTLLISDPDALVAGASLSVKVGHYASPDEYPGLAHFLEHMLFMGTKKYPQENYLHKYIQDRGGHIEAFTTIWTTTYSFTVGSEYLNSTLDVFSGIFKYPLLSKLAMQRELKAVDNEEILAKSKEARRASYMIREFHSPTLLNRKRLAGRFDLLQEVTPAVLLKFWYYWYRPEYMCLVITGKESLLALEKYALRYFGGVKSRGDVSWPFLGTPAEVCSSQPPTADTDTPMHQCFDPKTSNKVVLYQPFSPEETDSTLHINIPLPTTLYSYDDKSATFLARVFKDPVSTVISCIPPWQTRQSNVLVSVDHEHNLLRLMYTQAQGSPDSALKSIPRLLDSLEDIIQQLKTLDLEPLYDCFQTWDELRLERLEYPSLMTTLYSTATAMHFMPFNEALTHQYRWGKYNPAKLQETLEIASKRSNWLVMLETPYLLEDETIQYEGYYGIKYSISSLPSSSDSDEVQTARSGFEIQPLLFKPANFTKLRQDREKTALGVVLYNIVPCTIPGDQDVHYVIHQEEGFQAYLVRKRSLNSKLACIIVDLKLDGFLNDIKTFVAYIGAAISHKKQLQQLAIIDDLISNQIPTITITSTGVRYTFYGIPLLIENMLEFFYISYDLHTPAYIQRFAEHAQTYFTELKTQSLYSFARLQLDISMDAFVFDLDECIATASQLTAQDFPDTIQADISLYAFGNLEEFEFHRIIADTKKYIIPTKVQPPEPQNQLQVVHIEAPAPSHTLTRLIYITHHVHNFTPYKNLAIAALLAQICSSPYFDTIRTKKALGYSLLHDYLLNNKQVFLLWRLQTSEPFPSTYAAIQQFIQSTPTLLQQLTPEQYQLHQQSAILFYQKFPSSIRGYGLKLTHLWTNLGFDPNILSNIQTEISQTTLPELIDYATQYLNDLLTIHISTDYTEVLIRHK
ncbi:insulysin [Nematocida homosporus]|uniref:insulysin n=1 Tax=Nematocida homosporus TaxID=1912981 RepID=UPI00221FCAA1|nr:insulysin [Nematocida homosporus]KAI5185805.1 insulysin [Nematocida homosporus]